MQVLATAAGATRNTKPVRSDRTLQVPSAAKVAKFRVQRPESGAPLASPVRPPRRGVSRRAAPAGARGPPPRAAALAGPGRRPLLSRVRPGCVSPARPSPPVPARAPPPFPLPPPGPPRLPPRPPAPPPVRPPPAGLRRLPARPPAGVRSGSCGLPRLPRRGAPSSFGSSCQLLRSARLVALAGLLIRAASIAPSGFWPNRSQRPGGSLRDHLCRRWLAATHRSVPGGLAAVFSVAAGMSGPPPARPPIRYCALALPYCWTHLAPHHVSTGQRKPRSRSLCVMDRRIETYKPSEIEMFREIAPRSAISSLGSLWRYSGVLLRRGVLSRAGIARPFRVTSRRLSVGGVVGRRAGRSRGRPPSCSFWSACRSGARRVSTYAAVCLSWRFGYSAVGVVSRCSGAARPSGAACGACAVSSRDVSPGGLAGARWWPSASFPGRARAARRRSLLFAVRSPPPSASRPPGPRGFLPGPFLPVSQSGPFPPDLQE